jgi:hypothetical protein
VSASRSRALIAVVGGCLLIAVAALYVLEPAHALPAFLPGHVGPGGAEYGHHHIKHGIAAFVVALAAFAYAWFRTGPDAPRPAAQ